MRKIAILTSLLAICAIAGGAFAGLKSSSPVTIQGYSATGSFGSARSSADGLQYIEVSTQGNLSGEFVMLSARDATGKTVSCYADSPGIISATKGLVSDSFVAFNWNSLGYCTYIEVRNSSSQAPKTP